MGLVVQVQTIVDQFLDIDVGHGLKAAPVAAMIGTAAVGPWAAFIAVSTPVSTSVVSALFSALFSARPAAFAFRRSASWLGLILILFHDSLNSLRRR
jgi:hypothetical protein